AQLARYRELFQQNIIARQELDNQRSITGQLVATVKYDQAVLDSARLSLANCRITSAIDGRVEAQMVDPGNTVHPTDSQALMVITQLQPVAVNFSIAENDLPQVKNAMKGDTGLPVDVYDNAFENKVASGTLLQFENPIEQPARTVELKASFP